MRFTIDSMSLLQALKRLNVRHSMYPYVQIQARGGQISLLSSTRPARYSSECSMQVNLHATPVTLDKEGRCAVSYHELRHAAESLPGILTVALQDRALLVSGDSPLRCQIPLRLREDDFPTMAIKEWVEGEWYTKERSTRVECETCNQSHTTFVTDKYQITKVLRQQLRISRDLLTEMCAHVGWVAEPDKEYHKAKAAIQFELKDDVLTLTAFDDYCFMIRKRILTGSGSWDRPVVVPAARLLQALRLFPKGENLLVETRATQHQLIRYGDEDARNSQPFMQEHEVALSTEAMCVRLTPVTHPFPNCQAKFPSSSPSVQVHCSPRDLAKAVNAVMGTNENDDLHLAHFTSGSGKLLVEVEHDNLDLPAQCEVSLSHSQEAAKRTFILDTWYVAWLLKSIAASQEVSITCTDSCSPVFFHAGNELDEFLVGLAQGHV